MPSRACALQGNFFEGGRLAYFEVLVWGWEWAVRGCGTSGNAAMAWKMVCAGGGDRMAVNQDALYRIIGWAGNMTMSNASVQGVMKNKSSSVSTPENDGEGE